jgi:hypothetical protein
LARIPFDAEKTAQATDKQKFPVSRFHIVDGQTKQLCRKATSGLKYISCAQEQVCQSKFCGFRICEELFNEPVCEMDRWGWSSLRALSARLDFLIAQSPSLA